MCIKREKVCDGVSIPFIFRCCYLDTLQLLWLYRVLESVGVNPVGREYVLLFCITDIARFKLLIMKMIFGDNDGHMKTRDVIA